MDTLVEDGLKVKDADVGVLDQETMARSPVVSTNPDASEVDPTRPDNVRTTGHKPALNNGTLEAMVTVINVGLHGSELSWPMFFVRNTKGRMNNGLLSSLVSAAKKPSHLPSPPEIPLQILLRSAHSSMKRHGRLKALLII